MAKKNRKWTSLKSELPEAPPELPEREQKIRAKMDELRVVANPDGSKRPATMRDHAQLYRDLLEEEDFEELAKKNRSVKYEAAERLILEELKKIEELSGQDTFRGEGMLFSPRPMLIPIVDDKQVLRDWIISSGRGEQLTLAPATLKSIVHDAMDPEIAQTMTPAQRAELKQGEPGSNQPPPGVSLYVKDGVTWRRL